MNRQHDAAFDPTHATTFERNAHAEQKPASTGDAATRFDPVSFRQMSGLARAAGDLRDAPPPVAVATKQPAHGPGRGHLASWVGLGLISTAYLGTMTWQRGNSIDSALVPVTETLERLANDIADLKQSTTAIDARERTTAQRVDATESRLESFAQLAANVPQSANAQAAQGQRPTNRTVLTETPAATAASAPVARMAGIALSPLPLAAQAAEPQKPARQLASAAVVTAPVLSPPIAAKPIVATARATPPGPPVPPQDAANDAMNPIKTGSLPPSVPPASIGLLVASGPSLDSIKLSWTVLNQNHAVVLNALEPRIRPATDGSAFQLIAGPFATEADAQKACASLKARGVGCKQADYSGAPL